LLLYQQLPAEKTYGRFVARDISVFSRELNMNIRIISFLLLLILFAFSLVSAQSYDTDARQVGLGGTGFSDNIATSMIEEQRSYTSIPIPLGLIQLFQDIDRFDPNDKLNFDPVLALEYVVNPMHYTFGRDPGGARSAFITDIINSDLSRDLNDYRGVDLPSKFKASDLLSPNWGKTFKFYRNPNGPFQGLYIGAGPYFSVGTDLNIDKELTDVLASETPVSIPNQNFKIANRAIGQVAMAVTGGYRARFALPGAAKSRRDGIYIGINFNYLHGFQYLDSAVSAQLDTDSDGLLTAMPATTPLVIDYYNSSSGNGFALDFGVSAVVNRWEFGFGANGVANRINWHNLRLRNYTLQSLYDGGDFIEQELPANPSNLTVELPVRYIGNAGYHHPTYSIIAEAAHGFQGSSYHGGFEYRISLIEFRGGIRYSREKWHPAGGIGFNFGKVSFDIAAFGTTANLESRMLPSLAMSIRINHSKKEEE
jgi:hypothetical protein